MGIVYDCGAGLVDAFWARKDCLFDAYILSSGPSLKNENLDLLKTAPVFTVGINTTYPKFKPDMWVGLDYPKCFNENLWFESFPKVSRNVYYDHPIKDGSNLLVKDCPNVFFSTSDAKHTKDAPIELFRRRAHRSKFVWRNNTLVTTLHLLVWMGYKTIHLLGSDFGGDDYFDDSENARPFNHDKDSPSGKISRKQREKNESLWEQQQEFIKKFSAQGAASIDLKVISCTKNSPINKFIDYLPLERALENSKIKVKEKLK